MSFTNLVEQPLRCRILVAQYARLFPTFAAICSMFAAPDEAVYSEEIEQIAFYLE
jgi:hypothetical protein